MLLAAGRGSRFGGPVPEVAETLERVELAVRFWPLPSLQLLRGKLSYQAAAANSAVEQRLLFENAETAFREALECHPHFAEASVNLANVLSALQRDEEAEQEFVRAIRLQGGFEWGFRAGYSASAHHFRKAERFRAEGRIDAALESLLQARDLFDDHASANAGDYGVEGREFRLALTLHLGPRLESMGRHEEANSEYERALKIPGAECVPFLMARNFIAWGDKLWLEHKPEAALRKFNEAGKQANVARSNGFTGYPKSDLEELSRRIHSKATFLEGAGIRDE